MDLHEAAMQLAELRARHIVEKDELARQHRSERWGLVYDLTVEFWTTNSAADALGLTEADVRALCRANILVGKKVPGVGWLVTDNSVCRALYILEGAEPAA